MKTYNLSVTIGEESKAFAIMKEHGDILSTGGGFPVCPIFANWKGSEEGAEKLKPYVNGMREING